LPWGSLVKIFLILNAPSACGGEELHKNESNDDIEKELRVSNKKRWKVSGFNGTLPTREALPPGKTPAL
jgi:hypothetical protein